MQLVEGQPICRGERHLPRNVIVAMENIEETRKGQPRCSLAPSAGEHIWPSHVRTVNIIGCLSYGLTAVEQLHKSLDTQYLEGDQRRKAKRYPILARRKAKRYPILARRKAKCTQYLKGDRPRDTQYLQRKGQEIHNTCKEKGQEIPNTCKEKDQEIPST